MRNWDGEGVWRARRSLGGRATEEGNVTLEKGGRDCSHLSPDFATRKEDLNPCPLGSPGSERAACEREPLCVYAPV